MSQLKARCIEQILTFENTPVITSGNVNYDSIVFDFCSSWDGFTKTAIFYRSENEVFYQLLDEANTCLIPNEVLTEKGDVYIGVFGVNGDTTLTSQVLKYKITKGAITENLKPADPTPDIYEQILSRYNHYDERLSYFEERFNGSVGDAEFLEGHDADYFATAESVEALKNGTTPAGVADDSNKLGGHAPSYFATKKSVTDITDGTTPVGKAEDSNKLGGYSFENIVLPENKTVYVSPNGSDETGNGTQENPWKTIQKAVNECPPTGTKNAIWFICLANGVYEEYVDIRRKFIRINAIDTENTDITIKGGFVVMFNGLVEFRASLILDADNCSNLHTLNVSDSGRAYINKPLTLKNAKNSGIIVQGNSFLYSNASIVIESCKNGVEATYNACIHISGLTVKNCTNGFVVSMGGKLSYNSVSFENVTNERVTSNGGRIYTGEQIDFLPLTGGRVKANTNEPLGIESTKNTYKAYLPFYGTSGKSGSLGFKDKDIPTFINGDGTAGYDIHHDGNSAKVHIGTTAPNDTTGNVLFINTSG